MRHFADLIQILGQTKDSRAIQIALESYFRKVDDEDRMHCMAILSGQRPARVLTTGRLWDWAIEASALPDWLLIKSTEKIRDKCEASALIQPKVISMSLITLSECIQDMDQVRGSDDEAMKSLLFSNWKRLNHQESYVFNKLITGGLRLVVPERLMARALTDLIGVPEKLLIYRISTLRKTHKSQFTDIISKEHPNDQHSQPYPFCKIRPTEAVPVNQPVNQFIAERKWIGIRSQMIIRYGAVFIWSDHGDYLSRQFPDFIPLKDILPVGTVLEGVIIPWRNNRPALPKELKARSRAEISKKIILEYPVIFMGYDLLEYDATDLCKTPLHARRNKLQDLINNHDTLGLVQTSPLIESDHWDTIDHERKLARRYGCSGVVLKKKKDLYADDSWWSVGVEPFSILTILLYAQPGEGAEGFIYKNFSLAVKNGDELIPLARIESHLSTEEHELISAFVKENTIERFGPVRSVKPQLVFRITCTGIRSNKRRKSGVTLQNMEITEWCRDADPEDIHSILDIRKLGSLDG